MEELFQSIEEEDFTTFQNLFSSPLPENWQNILDDFGDTVFHRISEMGQIEFFKVAYEKLEEENKSLLIVKNENGCTVLHIALLGDSTEMIELILKTCPELVSARDVTGALPVHYVCNHGKLEWLRYFIGSLDEVDASGWSPLHYAVSNKHLDVVQELIKHNANVELVDRHGKTAFSLAKEKDFAEIANFFESL